MEKNSKTFQYFTLYENLKLKENLFLSLSVLSVEYVEIARKGPNLAFEVLRNYHIEAIQERKCVYSFENYSVRFMIFNIQLFLID